MIKVSLLVCWTTVYVVKLVCVAGSCQYTKSEAYRTSALVNKLLLLRPLPSDVADELKLFSQLQLHRNARFTAFGFFSIDFTLLFTMVGAVTTYLVIYLQFKT